MRDITYTGGGQIPAPLHGPALRYTLLPKGAVTDIAVHHMTGWNPPPTATAAQEIRFLQGIDAFHRTTRGLDGIGYHVVPMASGRVYVTARLDRYGAHVGYQNNHLIGLSLPGDYTSALPAPGHLAAAVVAVRYIYAYLGRNVPTKPHLAWGGTTCPGARWREWVPQLRTKALTTEEVDDMTVSELASVLRSIQRKKGRNGPLTTDEQALFDNLVALMPHVNLAYIKLVLGRPSGKKAQREAWAEMVEHPHPEGQSGPHSHKVTGTAT